MSETPETCVPAPKDDAGYYAGLLDAQLGVSIWAGKQLRLTLSNNDMRVFDEIRKLAPMSKETIVKRPGKKDVCVAHVDPESTRAVLEFVAANCVLKKEMAVIALKYMDGEASVEDVQAARPVEALDECTEAWASGFIDVRGSIDNNETSSKPKFSVKIVLPKAERFVLPALQRTIGGKIKKSSPCRLVFDTKDTLAAFFQSMGHLVRAKQPDVMDMHVSGVVG